MADELTSEPWTNQRAVLLSAANGATTSLQVMLAAIKDLEKLRRTEGGIQALYGEWLLVWTSGTKNYQTFQQKALDAPIKPLSSNEVIQRFDPARMWIENEVNFSFGSLAVVGSFEYTEKKRIQFTFSQLRLKLGKLPAMAVPMGQWAKGWLQTTYIDELLHIERGDRGGVSVYRTISKAHLF